ncbi:TetR/AcrR family transcriptional regulator [Bacillus sp. NP157]|nr:TetR/AcrR family transcriptional regulator [Bacillus sp. NP157]
MNDLATPTPRPSGPRPGGRSARVQAAVHQAVRELQAEGPRETLAVPAIAARAGVTPSTIYRRWGDLPALLADVAVAQLRPECAPTDTGSFRGDLRAWLEQYLEEMTSAPGRTMLRDVLGAASTTKASMCAFYCAQQLDTIIARGVARGEPVASVDRLLDRAVAPLMYRILFASEPPSAGAVGRWVDELLLDRVV